MIKFLQSVYALAPAVGVVADKFLEQMTGPELLSLHNLVASNLGRTGTKRFSDTKSAIRRTWAILEEYAQADDTTTQSAPPAPKPEAPDKPKREPRAKPEPKGRGRRFVFAPEAEIKPVRADSARGRALAILTREGGATFEEVMKATGWNEKRAYEGIRLLHYYSGYGLRQTTDAAGKTLIEAYARKK